MVLEYDGTGFAGFQVQPGRRTVQGELERAVAAVAGSPTRVAGAGRTDAGVHALGQVASFTTESSLGTETWQRALNAHLPEDVAVRRVLEAPERFHARFDARSREYRYAILNRGAREAVGRHFRWHVPVPLDLAAMSAATEHLVGKHDFAAFAGASSGRDRPKSTVRTVLSAAWSRDGDELRLDVCADAFLPHMVRTIVGTVVQVGQGKLAVDDVAAILASRSRARAGATAPPHGLCLVRVRYGDPSI